MVWENRGFLIEMNTDYVKEQQGSFSAGGERQMDLVKGTVLLLVVLGLFSLFSYKAPKGMKAMGALANAAVAAFLVEAFQRFVGEIS